MILADNPIFLTYLRLARRDGLLPAIATLTLVSAVIAGSMLLSDYETPDEEITSGLVRYGAILILQGLVLIVGGAARVARVLWEETQGGQIEANRLTSLSREDLALGYWFGPFMQPVLIAIPMFLVAAPFLWNAGVPVGTLILTQCLVFSGGLLVSLAAVLLGAVTRKRTLIGAFFVVLPLGLLATAALGNRSMLNFLFPSYPAWYALTSAKPLPIVGPLSETLFFGVAVHPYLLTFAIHAALCLFLWPAVTRKLARPGDRLPGWWPIGLFTLLLMAQYGLSELWSEPFANGTSRLSELMPTFAFSLIVAVGALLLHAPTRDAVRLAALRDGGDIGRRVRDSVVPVAIVLGLVTALLPFAWTLARIGPLAAFIVLGNAVTATTIAGLLAELSGLGAFRRPGWAATSLFVIFVMPFVFALVSSNEAAIVFSPLAPGTMALDARADTDLELHAAAVFSHLLLALGLGAFWYRFLGRWMDEIRSRQIDRATASPTRAGT